MSVNSLLTGYECSVCRRRHTAERPQTLCRCGKPLFARYDLSAAKSRLSRDGFGAEGLWSFQALLPIKDPANMVSLGEGTTPLFDVPRYAADVGLKRLWVKDEGRLPTGSFKARGLALAVSLAKEHGFGPVAVPSAGNAAGALSAYAARAGLKAIVLMPYDAPLANKLECLAAGAALFLVRGLISDAAKIVAAGKARFGWHDVSTLKEPGRLEGKKTLGYEIVRQLKWRVPEVIVYPTGGGTGLIGMWKAFDELEALGWIGSKRPRMIAVQAEGCSPIVRAFARGDEESAYFEGAQTIASGLRVPKALGDSLILRTVRQSRGQAVAVSDDAIKREIELLFQREGLFASPEGAATFAAVRKLVQAGEIREDEEVVVVNTATGLKYPDLLNQAPAPVISSVDEIASVIGADG